LISQACVWKLMVETGMNQVDNSYDKALSIV